VTREVIPANVGPMRTHAAVARWCRRAVPAWAPWLAIALCAGLACGGDDDPAPGDPDAGDSGAPGGGGDAGPEPIVLSCQEASGDRIRVVTREHGDGSSEFLRLHDTDFTETCTFSRAGDGVLRCLPVVDGSPFAEGAVRYSDKLCATPIAQMAAAGVEPPPYMRALVPAADACVGTVSEFHVLGAQVPIAPETLIFQLVDGVCTGLAAPATDFFAITEALPAAAFVEGTQAFTESGRVRLSQVDGADGSRSCGGQAALIDRDLGDHPCRLELSEDGSLRCLPEDVGPTSLFSDELCATAIEVALIDETCNAAAAYVTDGAGAACPLLRRVRALGGALPEPVFQLTDVCGAIAASPVAHEIGASVSPFSFAELAPRSDAPSDGDRLARVDLVSDDGLRMFAGRWVDTDLEQPCAFAAAEDGAARCLPIDSPTELTARATSLFTDDACTLPIQVGVRDPSCAAGDARFVLEAAGGGLTRVYEAGAAVPGPLYQLDATCVESSPGSTFHELGAAIVPQTFVGGTEMVE
jgi:hypothetical protein